MYWCFWTSRHNSSRDRWPLSSRLLKFVTKRLYLKLKLGLSQDLPWCNFMLQSSLGYKINMLWRWYISFRNTYWRTIAAFLFMKFRFVVFPSKSSCHHGNFFSVPTLLLSPAFACYGNFNSGHDSLKLLSSILKKRLTRINGHALLLNFVLLFFHLYRSFCWHDFSNRPNVSLFFQVSQN